MAKKKSKSNKKQGASPSNKKQEEDLRVTLDALNEMSESEDEEIPESQWSTKAKNLRDAIEKGAFDKVIGQIKKSKGGADEDVEFEEDTLGSTDDEEEVVDEEVAQDEEEEAASSDEEEEEGEEENDDEDADNQNEKDEDEDSDDDDSDASDAESDNKANLLAKNNHTNSKALSVVTAELMASRSRMPWAESLDIVPETPLPFEKVEPDETPVDIHDDLKREVAFYNSALEAVHEARAKCKEANVPFSRPEDFFAEMVKTDDHMAKVKDRLIFETKKMDAVAQRKSNREQKLRAKESHANKLAEKAKRKRDHFQQVEEWAQSAARNRGGALDDDADDMMLRGPNKKRQAADRKYGFGGKRGRFKQNDRATLNDVSGFNPRGNFPGMGTKRSAKSRSGAGAARPGKRARDARRSRS